MNIQTIEALAVNFVTTTLNGKIEEIRYKKDFGMDWVIIEFTDKDDCEPCLWFAYDHKRNKYFCSAFGEDGWSDFSIEDAYKDLIKQV